MREHEIKGLTLIMSQRWGHWIELLLLGYSQTCIRMSVHRGRDGWGRESRTSDGEDLRHPAEVPQQNACTSDVGGQRGIAFSLLSEGFSPTLASWRMSTSFKSSKRPWVREDRPSCSSARNWTTRRSGKFWPAMIQRLRRRLPTSSCSLWCTSRSLRRNWCSKLMYVF